MKKRVRIVEGSEDENSGSVGGPDETAQITDLTVSKSRSDDEDDYYSDEEDSGEESSRGSIERTTDENPKNLYREQP